VRTSRTLSPQRIATGSGRKRCGARDAPEPASGKPQRFFSGLSPDPFETPAAANFARVAIAAIALICANAASAQVSGGTFVNDSTAARDTLLTLDDRVRSGNLAEAARSLQTLLDNEPARLVATTEDPDLFRSVRSAVHAALRTRSDLLEVYADITEPDALAALERGEHRLVERTMLLTPSGFEATLRTAQALLERGRFYAAWRTLVQLEDHPSRDGPEAARAAADLASINAAYLTPTLDDTERSADGAPAAVLTTELLAAVFRVQASILSDPATGAPVCLPHAPVREESATLPEGPSE